MKRSAVWCILALALTALAPAWSYECPEGVDAGVGSVNFWNRDPNTPVYEACRGNDVAIKNLIFYSRHDSISGVQVTFEDNSWQLIGARSSHPRDPISLDYGNGDKVEVLEIWRRAHIPHKVARVRFVIRRGNGAKAVHDIKRYGINKINVGKLSYDLSQSDGSIRGAEFTLDRTGMFGILFIMGKK